MTVTDRRVSVRCCEDSSVLLSFPQPRAVVGAHPPQRSPAPLTLPAPAAPAGAAAGLGREAEMDPGDLSEQIPPSL